MSLDTCSWDEVDHQISLLLSRIKEAKKYMEELPRPLRRHDSDWLDVLANAEAAASSLRDTTYDLYAYAEK